MTKKDYIAIAEIISELDLDQQERDHVVAKFVAILQEDNIRFDAPRFEAACQRPPCDCGSLLRLPLVMNGTNPKTGNYWCLTCDTSGTASRIVWRNLR